MPRWNGYHIRIQINLLLFRGFSEWTEGIGQMVLTDIIYMKYDLYISVT